MKIQLLAAIAAVAVVGGCAYDPPFADAIPQASNECLESASQFGYSCTADKWMSERDQRALQYSGGEKPSSATASAPAAQPPTTALAPAIQAPTAG